MLENEVIAANHSSCKDECVEGTWKIENDFDMMPEENSEWSNNLKHKTASKVEVLIVLDLVQKVARNTRNEHENALKMNVDCKVVWAMLTADSLNILNVRWMEVPS